jgi:VanZ family protein
LENRLRRSDINYWLGVWLPVAVGVFIIYMESTEAFGSDHTSQPLRLLYEAILGPVSSERWETVHLIIRKCGHFLGYGLIGLAWLRAWWMTLPRSRFLHDALLGLLGTALVASCDEWHQTYLPNRTGSVRDVLLDCTGAITLQFRLKQLSADKHGRPPRQTPVLVY